MVEVHCGAWSVWLSGAGAGAAVLRLTRDRQRLICMLAHDDGRRQTADTLALVRTLVGEDDGLSVALAHGGLQWQVAGGRDSNRASRRHRRADWEGTMGAARAGQTDAGDKGSRRQQVQRAADRRRQRGRAWAWAAYVLCRYAMQQQRTGRAGGQRRAIEAAKGGPGVLKQDVLSACPIAG